jgi:hypothetical protein
LLKAQAKMKPNAKDLARYVCTSSMGSGGNMGFLSSSLWLPPHKYYGQLMEENQQSGAFSKLYC